MGLAAIVSADHLINAQAVTQYAAEKGKKRRFHANESIIHIR
jgi:hypothetical protein